MRWSPRPWLSTTPGGAGGRHDRHRARHLFCVSGTLFVKIEADDSPEEPHCRTCGRTLSYLEPHLGLHVTWYAGEPMRPLHTMILTAMAVRGTTMLAAYELPPLPPPTRGLTCYAPLSPPVLRPGMSTSSRDGGPYPAVPRDGDVYLHFTAAGAGDSRCHLAAVTLGDAMDLDDIKKMTMVELLQFVQALEQRFSSMAQDHQRDHRQQPPSLPQD